MVGLALARIVGDVPYRGLLWSEDLFKPVLDLFNISWRAWVNSLQVDWMINQAGLAFGILLLSLVPMLKFSRHPQKAAFCIVSLFVLDGFFVMVGKGHFFGYFVEHWLRFFLPLALLIRGEDLLKKFFLLLVGFTFLGHGLFAFGVYPVPGHFIDMLISILGVSESGARNILFGAGIFDFGIFLISIFSIFSDRAFKKLQKVFLLAFIWGLLTSLARIFAYVDPSTMRGALSWGIEFLVRVPHFLIPLLLANIHGTKNRFPGLSSYSRALSH